MEAETLEEGQREDRCFRLLPQVLLVHMIRTAKDSLKIMDRFEYPEIIDLVEFVDKDGPVGSDTNCVYRLHGYARPFLVVFRS